MADSRIIDLPELRDQVRVFRDRAQAGEVLADMLVQYRDSSAALLAIPAGGVPVAVRMAEELELSVDVAVASKITRPGDPEAGYGAVAFDGTVLLDDQFISDAGLERQRVETDIELTREKVQRRCRLMRGDRPYPDLSQGPAILIDDGLASGTTMEVTVRALRAKGASQIVVAVPTGHINAVHRIAAEVDKVYCPNIRTGYSFAVADAYKFWNDVDESDAIQLLHQRH